MRFPNAKVSVREKKCGDGKVLEVLGRKGHKHP